MRPPPVSAEILWISGRGNCKEAIFALENGIFRRGVLRVHAPLNSAWSSHTFAPPCANACAVFRPCGLRFAPCPRGSSRFAAFDARRARLRYSLPYWAYFGLFPPQAAAFVRPFSLREKGGFWAGLLHTVVPLTKRLPFPKGELAALAD